MSEVLELANRLRILSDDELVSLIRERSLNTANLRDFFDLAEQLLQNKNAQSWISSLNLDQIKRVSNIELSSKLENIDAIAALVWKSTEQSLKSNIGSLTELAAKLNASNKQLDALNDKAMLEAGLHVFATCQAITELIFDLETHRVKVVGKNSVASQELRRLGAHLSLEPDQVRELFELAESADLVTVDHDRWVLCAQSTAWLDWNTVQRWAHLLDVWKTLIGATTQKLFIDRWSEIAKTELSQFMAAIYPLGSADEHSKSQRILRLAIRIGLSVHDQATELFALVNKNQIAEAEQKLVSILPATQGRVIVQGDLSIVAPGPLSSSDERQLRAFVETEQVGIASRYRVTALSISAALENGITANEIETTLTRLSGGALPQPVTYLLNDTVKRFGRITVTECAESHGTIVRCIDPTMAMQLIHETTLRAFAFELSSEQILLSKYEPEVVYFGLREAGYLAVRIDAAAAIVAPIQSALRRKEVSVLDVLRKAIARLREADLRVAHAGDDETLLRKIQLAIKNKANVSVNYTGNDGSKYEFLLEPISIANGRLRGRDRKADIERTLTVTNITNLELA